MKSFVLSDIQKLAFDAGSRKAREGMTVEQTNEAIRAAVREACGGTWCPYEFEINAPRVFKLMAEIMPANMRATLVNQFEEFAEMKDEALGDKTYFKVEDRTVYPVLTVSTGNQNISRNKIIDTNFKVDTKLKGIKFFDELDSFMRGNMDFARLNQKATEAMSNYVGELISTTIYNSYSDIQTRFRATGAFDASTLDEIVEHIQAENRTNDIQIFGTKTALSNIVDDKGYSDAAKDRANSWGYYGEFRGNSLIALPQAYSANSNNFHVDTDHIIILPASEKIIKVVFEGDPIVRYNNGDNRNDMQQEILFLRKVGASALTAVDGKFGMYKFS
jgi:hypothetical protein